MHNTNTNTQEIEWRDQNLKPISFTLELYRRPPVVVQLRSHSIHAIQWFHARIMNIDSSTCSCIQIMWPPSYEIYADHPLIPYARSLEWRSSSNVAKNTTRMWQKRVVYNDSHIALHVPFSATSHGCADMCYDRCPLCGFARQWLVAYHAHSLIIGWSHGLVEHPMNLVTLVMQSHTIMGGIVHTWQLMHIVHQEFIHIEE